MTKVDIKRLDSVTKNDTTATERINDNFKALQEAIENTLSRDGTGPNYMDADLDMNSYRIINSANPTEDNDIVNLKYVEERIGGATEAAKTATSAAAQAANSAQSALISSTEAINTLRNTEDQLNTVVSYVDGAIQTIDNTIAEAVEDVKQQALDAAQESIDTAAEQATTIVTEHAETVIKQELNEIASNAAESADNAAESAGLAANEAGNAAISATDSQHYAEDSRIWAEGSDSEVENVDGEHSSKVWSEMAKTSATSAASSAELAKQYGNDKINQTHITNCITEIPQDIKLELNNGTLTLKAGSKVYVPNGAGKFDEQIVSSDVVVGNRTGAGVLLLSVRKNSNAVDTTFIANCLSGASLTPATTSLHYDTANNIIRRYSSSVDTYYESSLPIALVKLTDGVYTSIDQVFNGFGYIGSTVFALPGVKGLIPDGRNEDGTLKNTEFTVNRVVTRTITDTNTRNNLTVGFSPFRGSVFGFSVNCYYDKDTNFNIADNVVFQFMLLGSASYKSTKITSFTSKLPFRVVDYNDVKSLGATITYWE